MWWLEDFISPIYQLGDTCIPTKKKERQRKQRRSCFRCFLGVLADLSLISNMAGAFHVFVAQQRDDSSSRHARRLCCEGGPLLPRPLPVPQEKGQEGRGRHQGERGDGWGLRRGVSPKDSRLKGVGDEAFEYSSTLMSVLPGKERDFWQSGTPSASWSSNGGP